MGRAFAHLSETLDAERPHLIRRIPDVPSK